MYLFHKLDTEYLVKSLINLTYYSVPKEYTDLGESHDFWEMVYVDSGEVVAQADELFYRLKTGEVIFHKPGQFHNVRCYSDKPSNIIIISFECDSPAMEYFSDRIITLGANEKNIFSRLVDEAEKCFEYFENEPPKVSISKRPDAPFASEQLIKNYIETLLIYLTRSQTEITTSSREISSNSTRQHEKLAALATEYLKEHLSEKITLEKMAAFLNISISQLKRVFKEQTGESVISYLTNLKISEAKKLIRKREYNFTQISELLGYENIHYFSSQFKKETGMTPTEYSHSVKN